MLRHATSLKTCQASAPTGWASLAVSLLLLFLASTVAQASPQLTVHLIDHISGEGLAGVRVAAHELLADGSHLWTAARDTDAEGKARFDLDGLGTGRTYVLKAQPYAHWLTSAPITETGWHGWRVGRLAVQVLDGRSGAPVAGLAVSLHERGDDGRYPHVMNAATDAAGWLRLDPDALGRVPLVLRALSPTDGAWKYSAPYWGGGEKHFAVGNAPLEVELVNAITGAALAGEPVELHQRRDDGGLRFQTRRPTDAAGQVRFDVDGLGAGSEYVVRVEPYGRVLTSPDIGVAGLHRIAAGHLEVVLENGANGEPYRWKDVTLLEVQPDGSYKGAGQLRTDGDGVVRLDPPALGSRPYVLKAKSPADGSWKLSEAYDGPGQYRFVVGNAALTVRLIDHISGEGLAGVRVAAYELLADGSHVWAAARDTDAQGTARFDLAGLGEGRTYVLKAQPYAHGLTSAPITETGWHGWRVGRLAVQVLDGRSGAPVAGLAVSLHERGDDGRYPHVMNAATDAAGWLRLDPDALGRVPLVLRALSPTDGAWKYSAPYWAGGEKHFIVGNAPLEIELVNALTDAALAGEPVELYQRRDDGGLRFQTRRPTDAAGRVRFDVDGLGAGSEYVVRVEPYGRVLTSPDIGVAGLHRIAAGHLEVVLENGANGEPYRWKDVTLLEVQPDGSHKGAGQLRTDGDGVVHLDPPALGSRPYVLKAKSPADGSWKLSEAYDGPGQYRFVVGNAALTVRLIDHISGEGLAGVQVQAHEVLADGSHVWAAARDTDAEGKARFDLAGLGEGRTYVLKAQPYAHGLTSAPITETGWHGWRVGRLAVQVLDGQSGAPVAGLAVSLRERGDDGGYPHVMNAETDAAGWVRLDPDALGRVPLVLRALSPTDGAWKYSAPYWGGGEKHFIVGNAPLEVELVNAITGAALAGEPVELHQRRDDGGLRFQTRRPTDAAGQVRFDVDGLGAGSEYVVRVEPYGRVLTSPDIGVAGLHRIAAGHLEVVLENGANGEPYAWKDVWVLEVQPDGSHKGAGQLRTDGDGVVRLDPPALGSRPYMLKAKSPADGSWKLSEAYDGPGQYRFVVGNAALSLRLIDHISGEGLAGVRVAAHEVLADGSHLWAAARDTDAEGKARFDLDGLGTGRTYVLKAQPYAHGLTSAPITETGWYPWRVGTVPITLLDSATGQPLAGIRIAALEKTPEGSLAWVKAAVTDANGKVWLDLEDLGSGSHYVLRILDPYGDGIDHFGPLLRNSSEVTVTTDREDPHRPDLEPPQIFVTAPAPGSVLGDHGFTVAGTMMDNEGIRSVTLEVSAGGRTLMSMPADLERWRGTWRATVGAISTPVPATITITATALDQGFNTASATTELQLVRDVMPPFVDVTSHQSEDRVPDGAFVVSGALSDDIGPATIQAELLTQTGQRIDQRVLDVAPDTGAWAYTAFAQEAGDANALVLRLTATDAAGNAITHDLNLYTTSAAREQRGLLDRISFGASPHSLGELASVGIDAYLGGQLHPDGIDDSDFEVWLASQFFTAPAEHILAHVLYSRRQLREVMTWFWDNHFNTQVGDSPDARQSEIAENDAFRANALGRFRDLLGISAHSPAMLRYLDGVANRAGGPNENYARELLELHTLGITGGFAQADVEAVARAFTGWTIADNAFHFNAAVHDTEPKSVLGRALPPGRGVEDGEDVLDILASQPATAAHLCSKLIVLFLGKDEYPDLRRHCADAFLDNSGAADQMAQVVGTLLRTPEMLQAAAARASVRTPLEYVAAGLRILDAAADVTKLPWQLQKLGMPLLKNPIPTGYSEAGDDWVSTHGLLTRLRYLGPLAAGNGPFQNTVPDLATGLRAAGIETTDGITGSVLAMVHGPNFTRADWELGQAILTEHGTRIFDLGHAQAERWLRQLLLAALALPAFHYQ